VVVNPAYPRSSAPTRASRDQRFKHAYQASQTRVREVRLFGVGLGAAILFSLLPLLEPWVQQAETATAVLLGLAIFQAGYVGWMMLLPDHATAWGVAAIFFAIGLGYGCLGVALILGSAGEEASGLGEFIKFLSPKERPMLAQWCFIQTLVMGTSGFLLAQYAARWQVRENPPHLPSSD